MQSETHLAVFTKPSLVNYVFREFYSECYKFSSLSTEQADQLDVPLTLEERGSHAVSMTRHKLPGLDGIYPELLVELW